MYLNLKNRNGEVPKYLTALSLLNPLLTGSGETRIQGRIFNLVQIQASTVAVAGVGAAVKVDV